MRTSIATETTTWQIDQAHSKIEFSVSHMLISNITGLFRKYEGKIISEGEDFTNAEVEVTIDAMSIDTNNEQRDKHLKSAEFLDAINHPNITFRSTSIKMENEAIYVLKGDFTLRGITKNIELMVKHHGTVKDTFGNIRAGFKVTGEINRKEFDVKWQASLDSGSLVAGDKVKICANVEIIHQ
jgi:polyisoprenoid-binding protein YceI